MTLEKPPCRQRPLRLGQSFQMANGYKPAPLDTRDIELDEKMEELADVLAKNTHYIWAKEKIARGWTYGLNEVRKNDSASRLSFLRKTEILSKFH